MEKEADCVLNLPAHVNSLVRQPPTVAERDPIKEQDLIAIRVNGPGKTETGMKEDDRNFQEYPAPCFYAPSSVATSIHPTCILHLHPCTHI